MPSSLPEGDTAPGSGELPDRAFASMPTTPFGVYVHVPFCRVRCGYCDFNTYTPAELSDAPGAQQRGYVDAVVRELDLAVSVLGPNVPLVETVFFGGGTPTVLPVDDLARLLDGIRVRWGLAPGVEVTTEANPDTVTRADLRALAAAGYTRVSVGMQSAVPHVLATLERTHHPDSVATAARAARAAGLAVSLDLIYGTPGESMPEWERSLEGALALEPDHLSAYALVVEEGTRLSVRVRRGELPAPDGDELAAKYERADAILTEAGFTWYEVSNWARRPDARCRHNVGYWTAANWWGVGPGAHSHVGGVRWWNVRHPTAYAARLAAGLSPAAGRELLSADERYAEQVLLGVRLADGFSIAQLRPEGVAAVSRLVTDGLLGEAAARRGRVVLTQRGRLLADTVVRTLLG
ncbi:MAG: radical SAM family heme chaperone HemW [Dermatophilaceae bacterium]